MLQVRQVRQAQLIFQVPRPLLLLLLLLLLHAPLPVLQARPRTPLLPLRPPLLVERHPTHQSESYPVQQVRTLGSVLLPVVQEYW